MYIHNNIFFNTNSSHAVSSRLDIMFIVNYVYILLKIIIYSSIFNSQLCEAQSQEYVDIICIPLQQCTVATKLIATKPFHKETIEFLRNSFCGYDVWHRQLIFCPQLKPCVTNNSLTGVYTSWDNCHTLPRNNFSKNSIICCPNTISPNNDNVEMSTVALVDNYTTVVTEISTNFEQIVTESTTEFTNSNQVEMNKTNETNISESVNSRDPVAFLNVEVETTTINTSEIVDVTEAFNDVPDETTIFNFQAYLEHAVSTKEERYRMRMAMCGRKERRPNIFVGGGTESEFFEFPWMTILQFNGSSGKKYGCGGTLISKRYVLTAAHCVDSKLLNQRNLGTLNQVILGEYDLRNETDCYRDVRKNEIICANPPIKYDVESVIIHEEFNGENGENDIALIRLAKDVVFSKFIQPICLPTKDESINPRENFTIAGWGRTPEEICEAQSQEYVDILCTPLQQCTVATKLIAKRPFHKETIAFLRNSFCGYDVWHRQLIFCPELRPCVTNYGLIGVYTSRDNCHTLPRNNLIENSIICCPNTISPNTNNLEMSTVPSVKNHITVATEMSTKFEQTTSQSATQFTNMDKTRICGRRERRFKNEVAGGTISDFFEFPWMTILQFSGSAGNKNGCGGTLVSNRYVLTAAHCVDSKLLNQRNLGTLNQVILGEYDLRNETDCYYNALTDKTTCADPPKKYDVESVIVHEGFNRENGENDIALIRLVKDVIFSDFIQPICLPAKDESVDHSDNFTIAGWGRTPEAKFTPILLKAQIYRTEIENCIRYNVTVKDSQVCTGRGEDGNSCTGDSGGPLMIRKYEEGDKVFISYQYGIISYGFDKCATNSNSVNTYLPYYIDWILDKIEEQ